jgi:hypothetical protein
MPFAGPINVDSYTAAVHAQARAREVCCTCDRSPFRRGQDSADWLRYVSTCRSCHPRRPRRRPVRTS